MKTKILSIQQVTKFFENDQVLQNINLDLDAGKIYGLLGQNGTGKTTLMKCIIGLNYIDSGSIIFNETNISNGKHAFKRSEIGSLIEYPSFPKEYTVRQVLNEQLEMMNVKVDGGYLSDVIDILELKSKMEIKSKKLSLGWKQRLGIARAVFNYPKLLLLDEPFNGLDATSVEHVEKLIKLLANNGSCIIVSSHILDELQYISDEMFLVKNAEFKRIDNEISDNENIRSFYLEQFK